ncbi:FUSC family protein [Paraclostridium sordellii]|uniref:FUSC family protein n=1 Tax=Paraclostridium sordellii TaxID=1505 RepID=UPI0022E50835|nr:FUSC family protein [Paeniclostridium sordellii]
MNKNKKEIMSLIFSKTLIFLVVVLLVSTFKGIFGEENSLLGVTSVVLMLVLLPKDLTIHPLKNLFGLIGLNLLFGVCALLASQNLILALILNFAVLVFIGYYFSYELQNPVSSLFSLHYLLLMTNPVPSADLPMRFLALIAGPILIMAAQLLANKNKLSKSRDKMFNSIFNNILLKIELIKSNKDTVNTDKALSTSINELKSCVFNSGKNKLNLTECGRNTLAILSCLEKINILLDNTKGSNVSSQLLDDIATVLKDIKDKKSSINICKLKNKYKDNNSTDVYDFINTVKVLSREIKDYSNVSNNEEDAKVKLSLDDEFKDSTIHKRNLNLKQPRLAYGLRLGIVVSVIYFVIRLFNIEYGDWALYTAFTLTQLHSEYTVIKSKKRVIGTILGAILIGVLFNLIPDPSLRTLMLLAAGYIMSYMSDYRNLVIFITFSSVASASLSVTNPNFIIMNRVVFVIIGAVIAIVASKFLFPRHLSNEEENLNNIEIKVLDKMMEEVLINKNEKNKSSVAILSLIPSLIDLRTTYLEVNGLDMNMSLISKSKIIMNDLYQIHLLDETDTDYSGVFSKLKKNIENSTSVSILESRIQEDVKSSNNFKEVYLFTKFLNILSEINNIGYTKENQADLYQSLTIFN